MEKKKAIYALFQTSMQDFVNNRHSAQWELITAYSDEVDAMNMRNQLMSENKDIYITIR